MTIKTKTTNARPAHPSPKRDDGAGHRDPAHTASLLARAREGRAEPDEAGFLGGSARNDELASQRGDEFVRAVTSGEDDETAEHSAATVTELGGPFLESPGGAEFAGGVDASNPRGATREPFPKV